MIHTEKIKTSKNEFTEVLYYWLSGFLTEKTVKKTTKGIGFEIRNSKDLF